MPLQTDEDAWGLFRNKFILSDGRVVDTGNGGVSHTEGQGWGLLFAAAWNDSATFDRILNWTARTLQRPNDALHAWRYVPNTADSVADHNNATDGDLFIAWALARAAQQWQRPELAQRATAIGRSVLSSLLTEVSGRTLLLPGAEGFQKSDGAIVNPSYYAFAALDGLAALVPDPRWDALRRNGLELLDRARFGRWGLTCDWVWAGNDGTFRPAPGFAPRYGFDAVRVPLHLAWASLQSPLRGAPAAWWRQVQPNGPGPAWVDVVTGEAAPYPASPGVAAAVALGAAEPGFAPPTLDGDLDYYASALCLLTRVASRDISAGQTSADRR